MVRIRYVRYQSTGYCREIADKVQNIRGVCEYRLVARDSRLGMRAGRRKVSKYTISDVSGRLAYLKRLVAARRKQGG